MVEKKLPGGTSWPVKISEQGACWDDDFCPIRLYRLLVSRAEKAEVSAAAVIRM
jgi:hypothetical protein